jgi:hypothetical protein
MINQSSLTVDTDANILPITFEVEIYMMINTTIITHHFAIKAIGQLNLLLHKRFLNPSFFLIHSKSFRK